MSPHDPRQSVEDTLPTPLELSENPELGALRILRTSLEVAELALRATYPESCERFESRRTEEDAYALAILYQIDALEATLDEYVESIRRLRAWRNREPSGDSIPF